MTCQIHDAAPLPCVHCARALADIASWPAQRIDYAARERSRKASRNAYHTHATFNGFGSLRMRTHCKRGHEYTTENTYWYTTTAGRRARQCKACWKAKYQARKQQRRAA